VQPVGGTLLDPRHRVRMMGDQRQQQEFHPRSSAKSVATTR
jgi:hypothetical protein